MLNFEKQVSTIPGWLTKEEGQFLYESATKIPKDGDIVEIGSWKGRSTICFGLGAKDGNGTTIYAIDPHTGSSEHKKWFGEVDTYGELLKNIKEAGIHKFIIPIKKTSEEASKGFKKKVNFILVDGAHEYNYVKKDYENWFPKLVDGGRIAFHDCWHSPGVHFLTAIILATSSELRRPKLLDTLTIMEKCKKNNVLDRMYNLLFVIYRLLFGWSGTLKLDFFGTVKG